MDEVPVRIPIERELDLHAFAPRDIPSVVEEYVEAADSPASEAPSTTASASAFCASPPCFW